MDEKYTNEVAPFQKSRIRKNIIKHYDDMFYKIISDYERDNRFLWTLNIKNYYVDIRGSLLSYTDGSVNYSGGLNIFFGFKDDSKETKLRWDHSFLDKGSIVVVRNSSVIFEYHYNKNEFHIRNPRYYKYIKRHASENSTLIKHWNETIEEANKT